MRARDRIVSLLLGLAVPAQVQLPEPHAKALRALAPGGVIERHVVALPEAAHARLQAELRDDDLPRTWFVYVARTHGAVTAIALFDTHRVRTLRETLLVAFDAELRLRRLDVVAFAEPRRFLPKPSYYARYEGRARADLEGRGVDAVSGATLTSQATGRAATRALAFGAHLHASGALRRWTDAVPAAVRAAAGPAHAAALTRLRARFPGAEVRPQARVVDQGEGGAAAWVVAFEILGPDAPVRTAYLHTRLRHDEAVHTLVEVAADGSLHADATTDSDAAVLAVRAVVGRQAR